MKKLILLVLVSVMFSCKNTAQNTELKTIQDNIKKNRTKQTNWGIGTRVYPKGSDAGFSVFTRDGFESLADAMEALSFKPNYPAFFNDVMEKTKMNEYNPNGFQHQIIYENIKWVN